MITHKYSNDAMKTIKNLMLVAFAATSVIACQKEMADMNDVPSTGEVVTFSASVEDAETKTAIHYEDGVKNFSTLFTSADVITVNGVRSMANVLNEETQEEEYKEGVKPSADQKSITFDVEGVTSPYFAVTGAHAKEYYAETNSYKLQVSGTGAPQKYRTVADGQYISYWNSADILAAYAERENDEQKESEALHFQHMSTFYAITIDKANSTVADNIKNVYVRQGNGDKIAGNWTLEFKGEDHTPTLTPLALSAYISFDCGETGLAQGETMLIGIPAYNYENGLIFTIKDVNGKFASFKIEAEKTQHAAHGGKIFTFKPAFKPGAGVINSADDWNEFAAFVNNTPEKDWEIYRWIGDGSNTIKLGKDIVAEDLTPITAEFTYTFDGNGKTITRTAATKSLFKNVSGEVKNLTVAGNLTLGDEGATLVDALMPGGKVIGCTNEMTVTFELADHAYVGGLVKVMQGGTIENCVNKGDITVKVNVSAADKNAAVGGLLSQVNAGTETVSIKNCKNTAAVVLAPKSADDASFGMKVCGVGGILGWLRAVGTVTMENCDNEGNVTLSAESITSATGTKAYSISVGGVLGLGAPYSTSDGTLSTPTADNGFDATLLNCDNTGVVYNCGAVYLSGSTAAKKQTNKRVFTGGLAGSLLGKSADHVVLNTCTNTGEVYTYDLTGEGASTQACYSSVCGGLVGFGGYLDMNKCIINCTMGNGKRAVMSYGGVIGCAVMPFNLTNSDVFVSGYYNRIGNYQGNRALVAAVPVLFGTTATNTMNIAPNVAGSKITNCKIGGAVKSTTSALATADGEKTDDLSDVYSGDKKTTLFNNADKVYGEVDGEVVNNLVCGQGYTSVVNDVTVTGFTYWNGK